MTRLADRFFRDGWCRFGHDPVLAAWAGAAVPAARDAVTAPENAHWLRCGGTWFVGVHALPNTAAGRVGAGPALGGAAIDFIRRDLGLATIAWDRAQVSVCYPGYPQQGAEESGASFRFRRERDAAHVDGLLAQGPDRRRFVKEFHGFILGIALVDAPAATAPLVVWQGSHEIMRQGFRARLGGIPEGEWAGTDITETYHALRRRCFAECRRVAIAARPGEAYLVHRLALHGVAPWGEGVEAGPDGRMIAYFRPETGSPRDWLEAP